MVLSMKYWKGKVAIVTGASSGIGKAIAVALVEEGLQVVALARREHLLIDLAKTLEGKSGTLHPFKADVTVKQDILEVFKWTEEHVGPVSVLVNNAGTNRNTTLTNGDIKDWKTLLDTNLLGLTIATQEAVKSMEANGIDGHIIHMNSVLGHRVALGITVYTAAKFAITALTETLRQEMVSRGSKIRVTSLSPGFVDTEIFGHVGPEAVAVVEQWKKADRCLVPEDIAKAVVYVLSTPLHVQVHELTIKSVNEHF